jgi:hypothetical protein
MRGQWDNEQPLSPSLVRSAVALLGGLLVTWAVVSTVLSVKKLFEGSYEPAAVQFTAGLAIPFAIWLAARILADLLIVHHRMLDRLSPDEGEAQLPARVQSKRDKRAKVETAASDDGPAYPAE